MEKKLNLMIKLFILLFVFPTISQAMEIKYFSYKPKYYDTIHITMNVDCEKRVFYFSKIWTDKFTTPLSESDRKLRKIESVKLDVCPQIKSKKKV